MLKPITVASAWVKNVYSLWVIHSKGLGYLFTQIVKPTPYPNMSMDKSDFYTILYSIYKQLYTHQFTKNNTSYAVVLPTIHIAYYY